MDTDVDSQNSHNSHDSHESHDSHDSHDSDESHGETEHQRRDRELSELLQELRVALPGVQVLFAFLLVLPFQAHFDRLPPLGRTAYGITLLAAAAAAALLIAPTAIHRLNFRSHDKEWILLRCQHCLLGGTAALAVSMLGAVFVVASALYGPAEATLPTAAFVAVLGWLWYLLPLRGRERAASRTPA